MFFFATKKVLNLLKFFFCVFLGPKFFPKPGWTKVDNTSKWTGRKWVGWQKGLHVCEVAGVIAIYLSTTIGSMWYIYLGCGPQDSSDHQDYYIFRRGSLYTFISHCYWEEATPNIYHTRSTNCRSHIPYMDPMGINLTKFRRRNKLETTPAPLWLGIHPEYPMLLPAYGFTC